MSVEVKVATTLFAPELMSSVAPLVFIPPDRCRSLNLTTSLPRSIAASLDAFVEPLCGTRASLKESKNIDVSSEPT